MIISCSVLLRMRNLSDECCSENQIHILSSIFFFFENHVVYEIMWKKIWYSQTGHRSKHTLRIGNNYCFYTPKILLQTLLIVRITLFVLLTFHHIGHSLQCVTQSSVCQVYLLITESSFCT